MNSVYDQQQSVQRSSVGAAAEKMKNNLTCEHRPQILQCSSSREFAVQRRAKSIDPARAIPNYIPVYDIAPYYNVVTSLSEKCTFYTKGRQTYKLCLEAL